MDSTPLQDLDHGSNRFFKETNKNVSLFGQLPNTYGQGALFHYRECFRVSFLALSGSGCFVKAKGN